MIPREEVEFTLKMAEAGARCEAPAKVMEELCRVYLAWVDAPYGRFTKASESDWVCWTDEFGDDEGIDDHRVKLVEVE